ncbi:MAG: segregation/condensation protein A [Acetobacter fabarum]|jgi:segregation and condensation protein A|nr:segregation/condensation protein A [Acetobacter fabarum]MCI1908825.1 segregation/condensation protein A [Acetobacter fabarum]MCI1927669.1 segregation/condensation protein A [Acetobacter fabarum]MCI1947686.1 segregation/condensation protein A [Acetobacter fabarum]MCI1988688.1 segregation/condensation protein A [Acetobacter fabarum]
MESQTVHPAGEGTQPPPAHKPADPQTTAPHDAAQEHVPRVPLLRLEGFEGPMDLLLDLARAQKVDLARISILQLVEQYLAVVENARRVRLELAADWLVMAAWLAWLKSRLLLPADDELAMEGEEAAELLQERLIELACMGELARWLDVRPRLGRDVFARGLPENLVEVDRSGLALDMAQLMRAYLACVRRTARRRIYAPRTIRFWTVQDALSRLTRLLGETPPGWSTLDAFLPDSLPGQAEGEDALRQRRAAMAGTLIAGLELAKTGRLELRQDETFGQIMLRPHEQAEATDPQPEPEEDPAPAEDATPRHTREKKQDA